MKTKTIKTIKTKIKIVVFFGSVYTLYVIQQNLILHKYFLGHKLSLIKAEYSEED